LLNRRIIGLRPFGTFIIKMRGYVGINNGFFIKKKDGAKPVNIFKRRSVSKL
jgi:hypothetical protein